MRLRPTGPHRLRRDDANRACGTPPGSALQRGEADAAIAYRSASFRLTTRSSRRRTEEPRVHPCTLGAWRRPSGPTTITGRSRSRSTPPTRASTRSRERGCGAAARPAVAVPEAEYLDLEYMDWKSGGDTNFAPIATADGQLDCRGFWNKGDERPDKDASFTTQRRAVPDDRARTSRASARTSAGSARSSSSRRTTTPRSGASTATTTTASTPTTRVGSCGRGSSSPTTPTATCC